MSTSTFSNDSLMSTISRHKVKNLFVKQSQLASFAGIAEELNNGSVKNLLSIYNGIDEEKLLKSTKQLTNVKLLQGYASAESTSVALLSEVSPEGICLGSPLPGTEYMVKQILHSNYINHSSYLRNTP